MEFDLRSQSLDLPDKVRKNCVWDSLLIGHKIEKLPPPPKKETLNQSVDILFNKSLIEFDLQSQILDLPCKMRKNCVRRSLLIGHNVKKIASGVLCLSVTMSKKSPTHPPTTIKETLNQSVDILTKSTSTSRRLKARAVIGNVAEEKLLDPVLRQRVYNTGLPGGIFTLGE
jgi:hypothetical protein